MATMQTNLTCDLQNGSVNVKYLGGVLFSQDNQANQINVAVYDGGEPATISGTVTANIIRADGGTVAATGGSISGNVASITLPAAAYAIPGVASIIVKLSTSGVVTTLAAFVTNIYESSTSTAIDPGTIIPSVTALVAQIDTAVASIPADYSTLWTTLAPAFSTSTTYAAGQYVTYNGGLYRFTAAHTGNWSASDVVAANIGNDLSSLKNAIDDVNNWLSEETGVINYFFTPYVWISTTTTIVDPTGTSSNDNKACCVVNCQAGDVFHVKLVNGNSSHRPWSFIGADNSVKSQATVNSFEGELTAPTGSTKLVLNTTIKNSTTLESYGSYCYKGTSRITALENVTDDAVIRIEKIEDNIGKSQIMLEVTPDDDYYWNSESTTAVKTAYSGYVAYQEIPVSPGERYKVQGWYASSSKQHLALVVDDEYAILRKIGTTHSAVNVEEFSIPNDGAYILLTTSENHNVLCYKIDTNKIETAVGRFDYYGKNIAIIGDSISTNGALTDSNPKGNVPEIIIQSEDVGIELSAYVTYYDVGTTVGGHEIVESEVGTEITFTPVEADIGKMVGKPKNYNSDTVVTWWEVAQAQFGFNAIPVCWSGSSITDHEQNKRSDGHYIYKCAHAFHPSQIRKCGIRTPGTMTRTAPDMVIIYRGTNDFSHTVYARLHYDLTAYQPDGYPTTDAFVEDDETYADFVAGMLMTIKAVRDAYPKAKVVLCTLNYFKRMQSNYPGFPTRNGVNTLEQYNEAIRKIADYANCEIIDFAKDGITWQNAIDGYFAEGNERNAEHTHPTTKGHKVLGNRALRDMMTFNSMD